MGRVRPKSTVKKSAGAKSATRSLMVRLDEDSKIALGAAAKLRGISVSDYVRVVTVSQARKEVQAAEQLTISLSPEEQLAFWEALNQAPSLTPAQQELAAILRGEA